MRLDGFHPAALPPRANRPAQQPAEQITAQTAPAAVTSARGVTAQVVEPAAAIGEYIPAHQRASQPVHGRANQALASYQSMAALPDVDAEAGGIQGIDVFV